MFWNPKRYLLNQGIAGLGARLPLVQHFCAGAGLRLVGLLGFWGSIYRFEHLFIQLALHEGKKKLSGSVASDFCNITALPEGLFWAHV